MADFRRPRPRSRASANQRCQRLPLGPDGRDGIRPMCVDACRAQVLVEDYTGSTTSAEQQAAILRALSAYNPGSAVAGLRTCVPPALASARKVIPRLRPALWPYTAVDSFRLGSRKAQESTSDSGAWTSPLSVSGGARAFPPGCGRKAPSRGPAIQASW